MGMCSQRDYPGVLPLSIPGVVEGGLRLDPLAYGVLGIGVLDASGQSPALTFLVPNDPLLVGASFDVQGADIDGGGLITLTDNDLEIAVAAPPPASSNMVPIAAGTFPHGVAGHADQRAAVPRPGERAAGSPGHDQPAVLDGQVQGDAGGVSGGDGQQPVLLPGANRPVEVVTWLDAVACCDALSVQEALAGRLPTGYQYRLPTEAEWGSCCRAGTTTEFHNGAA